MTNNNKNNNNYTEYTKLEIDAAEGGYTQSTPMLATGVVVRRRRTSGWKILGYVLLGILLVSLLLAIILGTAGYFYVKHQVRRFTVTTPVDLPVVEMSQDELDVVVDRARLFIDTLKAGQVPSDLDLAITAHDLNGFLGHSEYLRGNAFVKMQENEISFDVSLPAKGLPGGKGRYLVGSGTIRVSDDNDKEVVTAEFDTVQKVKDMENPVLESKLNLFHSQQDGKWVANLLDGQAFGYRVPQAFIDQHKNLFDDVYDCPQGTNILNGIESFSIEPDQLVLHAREEPTPVGSDENWKHDDQHGRRRSFLRKYV